MKGGGKVFLKTVRPANSEYLKRPEGAGKGGRSTMKPVFRRLLVLTLALTFSPLLLAVTTTSRSRHLSGAGTVHSTVSRSAHKRTRPKSAATSSTRKTPASARKGKRRAAHAKPVRSTAYTRLARMQMDPARVESIQQALIGAGAFHGSPSGRWDSETHDAMARYQAANGFGVTGLPDAKSLMKLGLGPHALPSELSKTPRTASPIDPATPATSNPSSSGSAVAPEASASPQDK